MKAVEYHVLASLREDLNQGWVWLTNSGFDPRSVIKITNLKNNESIYCECLEIDNNYIFSYNNHPRVNIEPKQNTITINSWYRKKLGGITTKTNHELQIRSANHIWGKFQANIQHPQIVVRLSTYLAIISVCLGLLGIIFSLK